MAFGRIPRADLEVSHLDRASGISPANQGSVEVRITPSVLNADLANLAVEVSRIPSADAVHLDVMDNHFVPNLTIGLPVIESLRRHSPLPMDVHLMISDVDRWAPAYAEAGCESVTFHAEASQAPIRLARELRKLGAQACLALRPATPIEPYLDMIGEFDMLLLMTVEPGFGGQSFLDLTLPKIERARTMIDAVDAKVRIQVDGGVSASTIARCAAAGADTFVAGSAVFGSGDPDQTVRAFRALALDALTSAISSGATTPTPGSTSFDPDADIFGPDWPETSSSEVHA